MNVPVGGPLDSVPSSAPASAAWWRHLFVDAEEAQLVVDRGGIVREVNRKAARLYALHKGHSLFAGNLLAAATATRLRESMGGDGSRVDLGTIGVTDAQGICLLADAQLLPLEEGQWLLVLRDATRRRRMETHTQRLLAAIDSTPDVVMLTDAEFRVTFVNPAFEDATGYTIEEAVGQPVEFCQVTTDAAVMEEYRKGVRRGADWIGELTVRRKDGTTFPAEMTLSPIHDNEGLWIGAVAFQRDISSRRKIYEAFQEEKHFIRSIINSLDAGLYTLDGRLRITHVNDAWRTLPPEHGWLRLEGEPLVGRSLLEYVPEPARRMELERIFRAVLAEGKAQELQSVDATGRHWLMTAVPWQHDGKIRGLIYKVTDNSAIVGARQQLFQAQKMGTIGALAAGVAHDFNNMLLAIRGNITLAMMDLAADSPVRERLNAVEQAAARAGGLTQQLLSFSRDSDEKVTVLDFNEVIRDAAALAGRVLRGRVSLELNPTGTALKVQMDATRATQLLLNLCINAHDAMPKGGSLTITNELADLTPAQVAKFKPKAGRQFMRCRVTDTGTGIPPEVLPRIFTPFFTTKEKGKGTGLGLSIVHDVVNKAGGFIEVESEAGRGTTFHIYLPVVTGPLTKTDTDIKRQLTRGSGRVLVVDDLDLVLEFASSFLTQAGYQVLTANSADAAVEVLSQQTLPLDLVFTDYAMPGRNGWELIQEINRRWPLTKCLLASGYLDDEIRSEISRNKAVRILNKPYGMAEATSLVAEVIGKSTGRNGADS